MKSRPARVFFLAILAVPLARPCAAQNPQADLLARTMGPTPILSDLAELTDSIGGRPTGSPALERAVAWGLAKFREAGLENVRAESYTFSSAWVPREESAEVTIPDRAKLRAVAMPYSASTGPGGLEAGVVDVGRGDEAGFAAAGNRARGRWALVHTEPMKSLPDLFGEYMATPGIFESARKAGAAGVLYVSNRPARLLYRHNARLNGSSDPVPGVLIEREGGLRLARLLGGGAEVRVRARTVADTIADAKSANVVGEIAGGENPEEVVLLGAHLDSWDLGRGALDNGCNVALVIDAARQMAAVIRATGRRPRRTIRFFLYTGEEAGLFGSWADVRANRASLDRVKAMITFDIGTGRTSGFSLGGRADTAAAVDAALAGVSALGPFVHTPDAFAGTDNYDYMMEGVPTFVANQDGPPYLPDYHAESDTFDKVDARELKANTAIAAALAWGLADLPGAIGARQTRAEIEAMAKATGLEDQMKAFGLWDDFASGRRGRERGANP